MKAWKNEKKARHRVFRRHVIARVQHHQRAHARDDQREQPGVAVHAQGELQSQRGRPGHVGADHAAIGHLRIQAGDQNHAHQRDDARQPGLGIAGVGRQQRGAQAAGKRQSEDQYQRHGVPRMSGPPPASAAARDETNRGLKNGRNPGPVRRCTTRCPAGTSTNAPLNGADRNKRNSFLARPAKNLIRKISDSCKLCRDLCTYRGDDDMFDAQSLRIHDAPRFRSSYCQHTFF